jgi:hypothetical protein
MVLGSGVASAGVREPAANRVIVDAASGSRESDDRVGDEQRRGPQTHIEKYEERCLAHLRLSIHSEHIGRNLDTIFFGLLDEFRPDSSWRVMTDDVSGCVDSLALKAE